MLGKLFSHGAVCGMLVAHQKHLNQIFESSERCKQNPTCSKGSKDAVFNLADLSFVKMETQEFCAARVRLAMRKERKKWNRP